MITTNIDLNESQLEAWLMLEDKETEIIFQGSKANCGKTWLCSVFVLMGCLRYKGSRHALCRKNLNDLKKTTLKTFFDVCKKYGVKKDIDFKLNLQSNTITFSNGSEIYLINLEWQPSDPEGERFGGYELTSCCIDEVPQVTREYFDVLYSRIRYKLDEFNLTKKLLCTANPTNNWCKAYFYDRYIKGTLPKKISFISAVGKKNPFQGSGYEESLSQLSEAQYKRLVEGDWDYASTPDQLFKTDKIEDIFTPIQHGKEGEYSISADIARFGEDSSVIILWQGLMVIKVFKLEKSDTMNTANEILKIMNEYKIPKDKVIVDSDGVGGGVMDKLRCKGFINNAKPIKGEKYDMLKTQCYFKLSTLRWSLSDKIESKYQEQIKSELGSIRDQSDEYKYKINSKDEQKKLLGGNKSPDFSDAIMMRMVFELSSAGNVIIDFGFN